MWYVIWTRTGSERKTQRIMEHTIDDDLYNKIFIPMRNINAKHKGIWKTVTKPLFPGYLFVDTDDIDAISGILWKIPGFQKILAEDKTYYPLYESEEAFIDSLYRKGEVFDVSVGIIEGDVVKILSGPLLGMEGAIKKIDRHKRKAVISVSMFNRPTECIVGLEIIEKR